MNELKHDFKIVKLAEGDARCETDHIRTFRDLIMANETMYPEIGQWLKQKVVPGIKTQERAAFVGYLNDVPVVTAVAKKGADAKICHLKVSEDLQDSHLGEVFFSLMAMELRQSAKTIYFTLPESLWLTKGGFFQAFGFSAAQENDAQYRLFDRELRCGSNFKQFWNAVLEKIPKIAQNFSYGGFSTQNALLLSLKPQFAERILARKKTVELRRKFSTRWVGHRVNLYASAPEMSLVGEALISGVEAGSCEEIWSRYHECLGCSRQEFDQYTSDTDQVFAIILEDVLAYRERLPLTQAESWIGEDLSPPQSYLTLENNKPWSRAVSIAAYLHGCHSGTSRLVAEERHAPIPLFNPRSSTKKLYGEGQQLSTKKHQKEGQQLFMKL